MRRDIAISAIVDLCGGGKKFGFGAAALAAKMAAPNREALITSLLECGVIPESFDHSSTEEKLYAKYCDELLVKAFITLDMHGVMIKKRGNSADVEGQTDKYSIVGDAKAYRLSRSAINQKDLKITALSGWRGDKDFAVLVCPIYQYPTDNSQIYTQSTVHNVSLLGYVHLAFLIENFVKGTSNLESVWNIKKSVSPTDRAGEYWSQVDDLVCNAVGRSAKDLARLKAREAQIVDDMKKAEVLHLEGRRESILKLRRAEAIQQLLAETKIASRIAQISSVQYQKSDG